MTLLASFVNTLHENMTIITEDSYAAMNNNNWWNKVAKARKTNTKKEQLAWFLQTARIEVQEEGETRFADLFMQQTELEHEFAGVGLRMLATDFEDVDVHLQSKTQAAEWARQVGAQAAYWPQRLVADVIKAGETTLCYDGQFLFDTAHPVNPADVSLGTYSNLFTTAGSGALPIDSSVTIDVALTNLHTATRQVSEIVCANGSDPRNLEVKGILHPPALTQRVSQLTEAEFIPMASAGGAGSADVKSLTSAFGLGQPIKAVEMSTAQGGLDTSYYLLVGEITSNDLGGVIYLEREPFRMFHNNPSTDAKMSRTKHLEWHQEGRNAAMPGHPYLIFKCGA